MATRGRHTKYTPKVLSAIETALKLGATRGLACQYAGISEDSFARYMALYADFADAVQKAEGAGAIGWLAKIEKAANEGSWQAAAWKLERRYPHLYGRQVVQVDDWRSEVIAKLKSGELAPDVLKRELGADLATELFKAAGVKVE